MKRRIFISMCILAAVTVALSSLLTFVVMHHRIYNLEKEDVKEAALYIASGLSMVEDPTLICKIYLSVQTVSHWLQRMAPFCTTALKSRKHGQSFDRPEISAAMKTAWRIGTFIRNPSQTNFITQFS